jgi:hypothetical protein
MLTLFRKRRDAGLTQSTLLDNRTFYPSLLRDMRSCREELIIECPFITQKRMNALYPSFRRLTKRGVRVIINTRDPDEHEGVMRSEATNAISALQELGIMVLFTERHHRKLAIVDREILYEGSLNILSYGSSCEVMRRICSRNLAYDVIAFTKTEKYLKK